MATTPDRSVVCTLDYPTTYAGRPVFWQDWDASRIAVPSKEPNSHCTLLPGLGWRLASYQTSGGNYGHEVGQWEGQVFSPFASGDRLASLASNTHGDWTKVPRQRWHNEWSDVAQGDQTEYGDFWYVKQTSSDLADVRDAAFIADQAAYPGPTDDADHVALDRALIGSYNLRPDESLLVSWSTLASTIKAIGTLIRVTFCGIAGTDRYDVIQSRHGTGQYCLSIRADHVAALTELVSTGVWVFRRSFRFSPPGGTNTWGVSIHSDATQGEGEVWEGSQILFDFQTFGDTLQSVLEYAETGATHSPHLCYYNVPQVEVHAPTLCPLRLDCRRDVFLGFQASKHLYFSSGTIRTKSWHLPYYVPAGLTMRITFWGDIPTGTSITIEAYDAKDGTALTPVAGDEGTKGAWADFTAIQDSQDYYAVLTLNSAAGTLSPTLSRFTVYVAPDIVTETPTPVVLTRPMQMMTAFSLTGPDGDPSHETAFLRIADLNSGLDCLKYGSEVPVRLEVKYDPRDATKRSVWFSGKVMKALKRRKGATARDGRKTGTARAFPASDWGYYDAACVGEWARLNSLSTPRSLNLNLDPATIGTAKQQPWKVTDAIRKMLEYAGYPEDMISVPDSEVRLFSDDNGLLSWQDLNVPQYTPIGPWVVTIASAYLGSYLVWDANASTTADPDDWRGCWRLLTPPRPPYTPLAKFWTDQGMWIPDEETTNIKQTFIRRGTFYSYNVPPEGNIVIVSCQGMSGDTNVLKTPEPNSKWQVAVNWASARFYADQEADGHPAPNPNRATNPDWLGYVKVIYYGGTDLFGPASVALYCRRIYDMACHAQKRLQFEAPALIVTDPNDTLQTRPRLLRYGDMIYVDGSLFVVSSVNVDVDIRKGGSRFQHAYYEAFSIPALTDYSKSLGGKA